MTQTIRVLLADDHPALRAGLQVLLEREPDLAVVGEVGDGSEVLAQVQELRPDVLVLDCRVPGISGPEIAAELRRRSSRTRILALSAYSDEKYVRGMVAGGAIGYLMKDEAPGSIVAAVRATARGEGWFSPSVVSRLASAASYTHSELDDLTERELSVLRLVAIGRSNKGIARALKVTERTVEFHATNLLNKLGLGSRVEAAVWAKDHGFGL